jgi:hypothetical protein
MSEAVPSLWSIGRLAKKLGVSMSMFSEAVRELGIEPSMRIDGIPFFDEGDDEAVTSRVFVRLFNSGRVRRDFVTNDPASLVEVETK